MLTRRQEQSGFAHPFLLLLVVAVLAVIGLAGYKVYKHQGGLAKPSSSSSSSSGSSGSSSDSDALKAGKQLSSGKCSGKGPVTLSVSPMKPEDFSIMIPYGLMAGGHVTPIDHQYLSPVVFNSAPDSYEVRAMADGRLTNIQLRDRGNGRYDYRLVISHSCTFLTYYDLITSLSPELKAAYDAAKEKSGTSANVDLALKAGQVVGRIGGQTLDFAAWDTEKPLKGFINPDNYKAEGWKLYTADPNDYYTPELKRLMTERNPRTVQPIAGKIDYDQPGKLIGNWFKQGSGGYGGTKDPKGYWGGHAAFVPNLYEPSVFEASLGNWDGKASQFVAAGNTPNPADVGVASGLVKYELKQFNYAKADGSQWSQMAVYKDPKVAVQNGPVIGTVLVQVLDGNKLKLEQFPGKTASQVSGFGANAATYER